MASVSNSLKDATPQVCTCSDKGRNLVVCIDGTSNRFGDYNTNVIELYARINKDESQLTYYNSGIGTMVKKSTRNSWAQKINNTIDLMIAWNFEKNILGAYRWLSNNYKENDRIYLFGFSRGAYQVRALAGMIEKVGLIHKGNEEQIPFAYTLYLKDDKKKKGSKEGDNSGEEGSGAGNDANNGNSTINRMLEETVANDNITTAEGFKNTFCQKNVRTHFVGVWDTVSSVGITRRKAMPLTHTAEHICYFRHALALDERRVKFMPEYVHGGASVESHSPTNHSTHAGQSELPYSPHVKEVWFAGTHSDIGGGNQKNRELQLGSVSYQWMSYETMSHGLRMEPSAVEWREEAIGRVEESLRGLWKVLEYLPFKRLSYENGDSTTYAPSRCQHRKIAPGQMIHVSVAFCPEHYRPKAQLPAQSESMKFDCQELPSHPPNLLQRMERRFNSKNMNVKIELDIFGSKVSDVLDKLKSATSQGERKLWIYRLLVVLDEEGQRQMIEKLPSVLDDLLRIMATREENLRSRVAIATILSVISSSQIEKRYPSVLNEMAGRLLLLLYFLVETNDSQARDDTTKIVKFALYGGDNPLTELLPSLISDEGVIRLNARLMTLAFLEHHHGQRSFIYRFCGYLLTSGSFCGENSSKEAREFIIVLCTLLSCPGEPSLTNDEIINMFVRACMFNRDLKDKEQAEELDASLCSYYLYVLSYFWSSSAEQCNLSEQDVSTALHKLRQTVTTLGPQARELIAASLVRLDSGNFKTLHLELDLTTIPLSIPE